MDLRWTLPWLQDVSYPVTLQETDHWQVSEMTFSGCVVYGCDHGKKAILCLQDVCQVRRSWESYERCTAILVGTMMILSVYMRLKRPRRGNYISELELVRVCHE